MKVRLNLVGIAPLLQSNPRTINPLDPMTRRLNDLVREKPAADRTLDDLEAITRCEWEASLYYDPDIGPYIPSEWVEAALKKGGGLSRDGAKVQRSLLLTEIQVPLLYRGTRKIEEMYADRAGFVLTIPVRNAGRNGGRVMRTRPMFRDWVVSADAELDTTVLDLKDLRRVGETTGRLLGIGDYRPKYGRFNFTVEEL